MRVALINYNTVTGIMEVDEQEYQHLSRENDMVVDVGNSPVGIGYMFAAGVFTPGDTEFLSQEQQISQREWGLDFTKTVIDMFGTRNLELSKKGVQVNTVALAQDNSGIKILMETGALKTARDLCYLLRGKYLNHSDIYDSAISKITAFRQGRGYE